MSSSEQVILSGLPSLTFPPPELPFLSQFSPRINWGSGEPASSVQCPQRHGGPHYWHISELGCLNILPQLQFWGNRKMPLKSYSRNKMIKLEEPAWGLVLPHFLSEKNRLRAFTLLSSRCGRANVRTPGLASSGWFSFCYILLLTCVFFVGNNSTGPFFTAFCLTLWTHHSPCTSACLSPAVSGDVSWVDGARGP